MPPYKPKVQIEDEARQIFHNSPELGTGYTVVRVNRYGERNKPTNTLSSGQVWRTNLCNMRKKWRCLNGVYGVENKAKRRKNILATHEPKATRDMEILFNIYADYNGFTFLGVELQNGHFKAKLRCPNAHELLKIKEKLEKRTLCGGIDYKTQHCQTIWLANSLELLQAEFRKPLWAGSKW